MPGENSFSSKRFDKPSKPIKKPVSTLLYILKMASHKSSGVIKMMIPAALQTEQRVRATNDMLMSFYSNDANLAFIAFFFQLVSELIKLVAMSAAKLANKPNDLVFAGPLLSIISPKSVAAFVQHTRNAANLVGDIRVFNRLWGLIPISVWAFDTYHSPPKDAVLRTIVSLQVLANLIYQPLENIAYLAQHSIIGGVSDKIQSELWLKSSYFWGAHVFLEICRVFREYQLAKQNAVAEAYSEAREQVVNEKTKGEKSSASAAKNITPSSAVIKKKVTEAIAANRETWIRDLTINLSYLPLTVHFSLEKGLFSDLMVGLLGVSATAANVLPKWRSISSPSNKKQK